MGNKYRQPPSDLIRSQLDVIDRISTLESTPRAPATTVDNGTWRYLQGTGQEVVRFGALGGGVTGWMFRRGSNGTPALWLGGTPSNEFFALSDNAGNILFSDNTDVSGAGMARPYIPYSAVKVVTITTGEVTTTSGTFQTAYVVCGKRQHPNVAIQYIVQTPAGVSMQVQFVDTTLGGSGAVLLGPITYPGNSFFFDEMDFGLPEPALWYTNFNIDIQIRVSAGAGTVGVSHITSYGVQA
jgi:hypothetical protein